MNASLSKGEIYDKRFLTLRYGNRGIVLVPRTELGRLAEDGYDTEEKIHKLVGDIMGHGEDNNERFDK